MYFGKTRVKLIDTIRQRDVLCYSISANFCASIVPVLRYKWEIGSTNWLLDTNYAFQSVTQAA